MLRSSQVLLWCARRREAELSEMWEDTRTQCWVGQRVREGAERGWVGFLVWMESLAVESHITPITQEGAFSQVSLTAQVICAAEFQVFSDFPALLTADGGGYAGERAVWLFLRTSHLSLAAAGFWVNPLVLPHLRKLLSYLCLQWVLTAQRELCLLIVTISPVQRCSPRGRNEHPVPARWTAGLIFVS